MTLIFGFPVLIEPYNRLRLVDYEEAAKQRKEEARNNLEGYLYRVRDLLDDSHQETPFKKCSQESERKAIAEKVSETIAWLHDKGDLAETSQFWDKRNAVQCVALPCLALRCHRLTACR
jgi:hypoxia up-regulated 1